MRNSKYVVIAFSDLDNIDYSEVLDTSADTVNKKKDNTEFIVEYEGTMPASVAAATIVQYNGKDEQTQAEACAIVANINWSDPSV